METSSQNETNLSRVKSAFENGLRLTVLTAVSICETVDLRKYVSMLRESGMDIKDDWIQKGKKSFKVYWLNKSL